MSENKKKINVKELIKSLLPIIILLCVAIVLTVIFLPEIRALGTEEGRESFKSFIDSLGIFGWFFGLLIVLLQIFIAFIPGEPVELIMGYTFGPWLGTFICLLGSFIGAAVIYIAVKKLGMPFIKRVLGNDDLTKYKFLSNEKRIEFVTLLLFLIPGTPKDVLLYIIPLTPINPAKYLFISTFARIPSIVSSTFLGDSVADGDYLVAIIVFLATALVSVLGLILGNKYLEHKNKS